jgi:isopenicillin N synthase-like dioxygenase
MDATVPSVDLADLHSDDSTRLDRAAAAIREGYGVYGLVTIAGHPLDRDEVDAYYDDYRDFTARSDEEKAPLNRPEIWYQRGWTPPNTEAAVVAEGRKDFKECYFAAPLPLDPVAAAMYPELYAENIWPEGATSFRDRHMKLGQQLHAVGMDLLGGCERALGLDAGTFAARLEGAAHVTRSLWYIPVTQDDVETGVLWGEEHTDFNLLTMLAGGRFYDPSGNAAPRPDDRSGLYLRTRPSAEHPRGRMVVGRAPPGHIVSQVGQQLEILTGGTFLATPHVIKAPGIPGWSRTSLAHFLHVHALQPLAPLAPFQTPDAVAAYRPPVLAGTYAIKTLVDISLAPSTTLDELGYRHYDRLADIRAGGEW